MFSWKMTVKNDVCVSVCMLNNGRDVGDLI